MGNKNSKKNLSEEKVQHSNQKNEAQSEPIKDFEYEQTLKYCLDQIEQVNNDIDLTYPGSQKTPLQKIESRKKWHLTRIKTWDKLKEKVEIIDLQTWILLQVGSMFYLINKKTLKIRNYLKVGSVNQPWKLKWPKYFRTILNSNGERIYTSKRCDLSYFSNDQGKLVNIRAFGANRQVNIENHFLSSKQL